MQECILKLIYQAFDCSITVGEVRKGKDVLDCMLALCVAFISSPLQSLFTPLFDLASRLCTILVHCYVLCGALHYARVGLSWPVKLMCDPTALTMNSVTNY
jgi:hypothetical protein